ncbi:uncharacterized protein HKW66_Vig0038050 [Vigna angularis]|uniref:Uncharacterized protein n=1 Tax=Phaseolus angularis TaxID=3914 RepID=A0A8T0LFJ8_PHAAN|nr:uncharacterized protein HKW66_Vig0038050 [Vigna angularis]
MVSLQGSLRDEGAMTERLRRFRVRRSTHNLGFRLAVVLDWSERTRRAIGVARVFCVDGAEQWMLAAVCFAEMGMITPAFGSRRIRGRGEGPARRLV